jgi:Asp/Glu/hydantoin racemase
VQAATESGVIRQRVGQMVGGHAVGIIVLNVGYPLIPGNVANATTFPFPVRYRVVDGADIPSLLAGDRSLLEPSLAAARELEKDGCHAIVGACGYFAKFQREMAAGLGVPAYMSSLLQAPMILSGLKPGEALGVVCASAPALDSATLASVGIPADAAIRVSGLQDAPAFRASILEGQGWIDNDAVRDEVVATATSLVAEHPEIRALLLECSDMPPYAAAVQRATGVPVWDFTTLIGWIQAGVVRRPFEGFV